MPNTTGYLLYYGTTDKTTLQGNDNYIVENFTAAAGETWNVTNSGIVLPFATRRTLLNGRDSTQGYASFTWSLILSKSQVDYLLDNFTSNRIDGLVTAQTLDMTNNTWNCYTAIMSFSYDGLAGVNNNWLPGVTLTFKKASRLS